MHIETREGHTVKLWLAASVTCLVYTQPLYIIFYIYIYIYVYIARQRDRICAERGCGKKECVVLRADLAGEHPTLRYKSAFGIGKRCKADM